MTNTFTVDDNYVELNEITGLFHDDIKGNKYLGLPSGMYVPINIKDRENEEYEIDLTRPFYVPVDKIDSLKQEMAKIHSEDSLFMEVLDDVPEESNPIPDEENLQEVMFGGSPGEQEPEEQELKESMGQRAGPVEIQNEEEDIYDSLEGKVELEEDDALGEIDEEDLDELDLELEEVDEETKFQGEIKIFNAFDVTRVKELITDEDVTMPELRELKRSNLLNLVNIANAQLGITKGQLLLEHQGLPSWIIPIIAVTKNPVGKFTDDIETTLYEMDTRDGCTIETKAPYQWLHAMARMDTDDIDKPAGGWLRERRDHTLNVVHHGDEPSLKDTLVHGVKKLKANQYDMQVILKSFARAKLERAKNDKNMYGRLLGMPNQIEKIITSDPPVHINHIHVVGFVIRPVGTPRSKPLTGDERIVTVKKDSSMSSERVQIADILDSIIRSIPDILREHSNIVERCYNLYPLKQVLTHYKYGLGDLTVEDMELLRPYFESNNSKALTSSKRWSKVHTERIKALDKRVSSTVEFNPLNQLDSGRYHFCNELVEYLKRVNKTTGNIIPMAEGSDAVKGETFPVGTDDIHVTSSEVYYRSGKYWYTANDYQKINMKYARVMYNSLVDKHPEMTDVMQKCRELSFSLTTIKVHHDRMMRGVMSLLEDSRSQGTTVSSPEVNLLMSFDIATSSGEKMFKEYLNSYIHNGIVAEISNFYRMKATGEIICCKHVYRQIHNQEVDNIADSNGKCIYCGVGIVEQIQKDDFNQLQQTTIRDMYLSENTDMTENNPNRMLEIFTNMVLRKLDTEIQYKLTPDNIQEITDDVIQYINDNHPELVDPYRTNDLPAKPIGQHTSDLLTGILYNMPASNKDNSTLLFKTKGNTLSINNSIMSQIYDYIQEMTGFNLKTYEVEGRYYYEYLRRQAIKSKTIRNIINDRANIFAMGMLKPFAKIFGIVLAHLIKKVNEDYNVMAKADILKVVTGQHGNGQEYMITIMNQYHEVIRNYISTAISYLKVASLENRELVRGNYENMHRLFEGKLDKKFFDVQLLGDLDVWAQVNGTVEKVYTSISYGLKVYQEVAEQEHKEDQYSLAKFERDYNGLHINLPQGTGVTRSTDIEQHMKCLAQALYDAGDYGRRLWQHYATVLGTDLDELSINPTWESEDANLKISDIFEMERKGTNITDVGMSKGQSCLYDAMASSMDLYMKPGMDDEAKRSVVLQNYLDNEQTFKDYVKGKSDLTAVMRAMEPFNCTMMTSLQSDKNNGFKAAEDFRSNVEPVPIIDGLQLPIGFEAGEQLNIKSFQRPLDAEFIKRLHVLIKYMKEPGQYIALGGLFDKYKSILEANISDEAIDTIVRSATHQKSHDRRGVMYYQDSQEFMPVDLDDELFVSLGMSAAEWPVPTKEPESKTGLIRRKLIRRQQLGSMLRRYFQWVSAPLGDEDQWNNKLDSVVETDIGSNTYTIEKDILDMDGYFLEGLYRIRKTGVSGLQLDVFNYYLPELYKMSYSEFKKYVDDNYNALIGEDDDKLEVFDRAIYSDMIAAAIRLDLLMHYKFVIKSDIQRDVKTIHRLESEMNVYVEDNGSYVNFLNDFFTALNTTDVLDPIRSEIDKIYEVRFLDDIKRRFINKSHLSKLGINAGKGFDINNVEEEQENETGLENTDKEKMLGAQIEFEKEDEGGELEMLEDDGNLNDE